MTDAIEIIRGLAEDAADCGDGDCGDHDVPILAAVTAAAWYEDGLKMLALDIEQKTAEIETLRSTIRDANALYEEMAAERTSLRKIEEAARALLDAAFSGDDYWSMNSIPMAAPRGVVRKVRALRAALGEDR